MNPERETAEKAAAYRIAIDRERCKGCGYCVEFCPRDVLTMSDELNPKGYTLPAVTNEANCRGCDLCTLLCPEFAVTVTGPPGKNS